MTIVDGTESAEEEFRNLTFVPYDEHDLSVMLGHAKVVNSANELHSYERTQEEATRGGYQLGSVSVFVGESQKYCSL